MRSSPHSFATGRSGVLLWLGLIVLAFVVPLLVTLGAIVVSSYAIPLP